MAVSGLRPTCSWRRLQQIVGPKEENNRSLLVIGLCRQGADLNTPLHVLWEMGRAYAAQSAARSRLDFPAGMDGPAPVGRLLTVGTLLASAAVRMRLPRLLWTVLQEAGPAGHGSILADWGLVRGRAQLTLEEFDCLERQHGLKFDSMLETAVNSAAVRIQPQHLQQAARLCCAMAFMLRPLLSSAAGRGLATAALHTPPALDFTQWALEAAGTSLALELRRRQQQQQQQQQQQLLGMLQRRHAAVRGELQRFLAQRSGRPDTWDRVWDVYSALGSLDAGASPAALTAHDFAMAAQYVAIDLRHSQSDLPTIHRIVNTGALQQLWLVQGGARHFRVQQLSAELLSVQERLPIAAVVPPPLSAQQQRVAAQRWASTGQANGHRAKGLIDLAPRHGLGHDRGCGHRDCRAVQGAQSQLHGAPVSHSVGGSFNHVTSL